VGIADSIRPENEPLARKTWRGLKRFTAGLFSFVLLLMCPNFSVSTLSGVLGFVSAFLAIYNLLPSARTGRASDGDHLRRMRRADAGWSRAIAVTSLFALIRYDARPRDRPLWMRDALRSLDGDETRKAAAAMDIAAALDAPPIDTTKVRAMIESFRADCGDSDWLSLCDAYLAAVGEDDVAHAIAVRWEGAADDYQLPLRLAVDAAIAARKGDRDLARELLDQMRVAARAAPWMRPVFRDIGDQVGALLIDEYRQSKQMLPKSLTR